MNNKIIILNDFINTFFSNTNSYSLCIEVMSMLYKFLVDEKYHIDRNLVINILMGNEKFSNCIKTIYDNNKDKIDNDKLSSLFNNQLLNIAIDAYRKRLESGDPQESNLTSINGLNAYFHEVEQYNLISQEDEYDLAVRMKKGDIDAKNKLIESNLRLVCFFARKYVNRGIPFQDLIQEGNLGLMRAAETFDPEKNTKFSIYAQSWIVKYILYAINTKASQVTRSRYVSDMKDRYYNKENELIEKLGREPTIYEMSKELGVSVDKINKLLMFYRPTVNLDDIITNDSDTKMAEMIEDPNINVEDEAMLNFMKSDVKKLFEKSHLSKVEADVIYYLYGFDGGEERTCADVGRILNVTRQYVRQTRETAFKKLIENKYWISVDDEISQTRLASLARKKSNKSDFVRVKNTIYYVLPDYSKEEIDAVIYDLSEKDRVIIEKRYGKDLCVPHLSELNGNELRTYYRRVLPTIKMMLNKNREKDDNTIDGDRKFNRMTIKILKILKKSLNSDDYDELKINLIKLYKISQAYSPSSVELIILLLSSGFVNHKFFANNEIANMLEMDYDYICNTKKVVMAKYNNCLERLHEIIDKSQIIRKKY